MLYYSKFCISHAYLPKDQHINDYSWITYLKNQVLNLQHSVREKKKSISMNIQIMQRCQRIRTSLGSSSRTQYVSNEEQHVFFLFCLKHGISYVFFSPRSVWTNRTKNTGTLKMQLHQQFSVLYS